MAAVPFDTLALARKLEAAGFPAKQAQDTAAALADTMAVELATKADLREAVAELGRGMQDLDHRVTIRLGSMIAAGVGILLAANFFA